MALDRDNFSARIRKNERRLRAWRSAAAIEAYRVYDRELQSLPLVIERYGDKLHLTEYPEQESLGQTALEELGRLAASELEIEPSEVFIKVRSKGASGLAQFDGAAAADPEVIIREGGASLLVNLRDNMDTGLFLDHRPARGWVANKARGKKVLNLFAYTCAFSVHAALADARSTTSVDSSKRYLEWGKKNFALSGIELNERHRFYARDVLRFLERAEGEEYDLVVLDPPTFGTVRGKGKSFSVLRDQLSLLEKTAKVMRKGGVLYFSSNARRLKLKPEVSELFRIEERSEASIPDDFSDRSIHQLWRMIKR